MEESENGTPIEASWSWAARAGAIQNTGTVPERDNFKLSCGLPQCPRDQSSGQMSGVTENKFIFPQWKKKEKKKKRAALRIRNQYLHISEFGWSRLENVPSSLWLLWRQLKKKQQLFAFD